MIARRVPTGDDLGGGKLQAGLTQGKLPGRPRARRPHADHRLVEAVVPGSLGPRGCLDVPAADNLDLAQVALVAAVAGEDLEGDVLRIAEDSQQGRPGAAGPLAVPGLPAVGGRQDRAQVAHGPTTGVVGERDRMDWQALAGPLQQPGAAGIGTVQDSRAGNTRDPDLGAADLQGVEVELGDHDFGQWGGRQVPACPRVAGDHDQPSLADEPAVGRGYELEPGEVPQAEVQRPRRLEARPMGDGNRTVAGHHALIRGEEVAAGPARRAGGGQRIPVPPAVLGDEHSRGEHRRGTTDGPAVPLAGESHLLQGRQQQFGVVDPMLAAIVGEQNHARAVARVGQRTSAGGPARVGVEKEDGVQRATNVGSLEAPVLTAVVRVPDGAPIAHSPALNAVDERDVAQPCVRPHGLAARRVGDRPGVRRRRIRLRQPFRRGRSAAGQHHQDRDPSHQSSSDLAHHASHIPPLPPEEGWGEGNLR